MRGSDFRSLDEFIENCRNQRNTLDCKYVLGKIYAIEELRLLTERLGSNNQVLSVQGRGISKRYETAKIIANQYNSETIGNNLSWLDHELYFPILSYYKFPDDQPYSSMGSFIQQLNDNGIDLSSDFIHQFNGITNPPSRNCQLESIRLFSSEEIVSLLFSFTRILIIPDAPQGSFENYFLARVPVLVRVIFPLKLIEVSLPYFSEPVSNMCDSAYRIPERFQEVVSNAQISLLQLIPFGLRGIDFKKISLYLETNLSAIDMGWKIAPQEEASFDLTQGLIPLREILDSFGNSLTRECERRGITHVLQSINLYKIFRSLKEQSYTYSIVQKVPLRSRGGKILLSILYGLPNSGETPVIYMPRNNDFVLSSLREAVMAAQEAVIENPYNLDSLFNEQD